MADSFEDDFEAQIEAQSCIQKVKKEIDEMTLLRRNNSAASIAISQKQHEANKGILWIVYIYTHTFIHT